MATYTVTMGFFVFLLTSIRLARQLSPEPEGSQLSSQERRGDAGAAGCGAGCAAEG
jgi:hypothetical protein